MNLPFFGAIFHVGLYSFFGYDDIESARRRKIGNGSEWILARIQDQSYRPLSGSHQAKSYFSQFGLDYFKVPFIIERKSIEYWLDICVTCKMSHVLITARHHDGYCLWNTSTTNNKPYNDVVQIFKEEAQKRGLHFGIYYSWFEFLQLFTVEYFNRVCIPQLLELDKYDPNMIWFDGDWKITQKSVKEQVAQIVTYFKSKGVSVNDRITSQNISLANYYVGPDRNIPTVKMDKWQHITTIGISWGYNREQQKKDFKSGKELYDTLVYCANNGGCMLLNIGPKHDGNLDEREVTSLRELSLLLK